MKMKHCAALLSLIGVCLTVCVTKVWYLIDWFQEAGLSTKSPVFSFGDWGFGIQFLGGLGFFRLSRDPLFSESLRSERW
jgi:hypothetical protein